MSPGSRRFVLLAAQHFSSPSRLRRLAHHATPSPGSIGSTIGGYLLISGAVIVELLLDRLKPRLLHFLPVAIGPCNAMRLVPSDRRFVTRTAKR